MQNDMTKEKLERARHVLMGSFNLRQDNAVSYNVILSALDAAIAATEVDAESLKQDLGQRFIYRFDETNPVLGDRADTDGNIEFLAKVVDHLASLGLIRTADTGGWQKDIIRSSKPAAPLIRRSKDVDGTPVVIVAEWYWDQVSHLLDAEHDARLPTAPTHPEVSND